MDEKKFLNLLKNLQKIMHCPSCGEIYEVSEIQFVGSQDGYFLLSMTCLSCSLPVWVSFFSGNKNPAASGELTAADFELLSKAPVSSAEVVDFHLYLKKFDGNFKKVLKKKSF